ncbi:MAG: hypothetical protein Q8Q28_07890 [Pseudomonadota bacterium]|nr:hypothetical protein [Pseudomonadota bacterium]
MKMADLKQRLTRNRPMVAVTLRMPLDVIEDLKRVAPWKGFSGYQPLMRTYIGQGLREDLAKLDEAPIARLVESLRQQGVSEETLARAVEELAA